MQQYVENVGINIILKTWNEFFSSLQISDNIETFNTKQTQDYVKYKEDE